MVVEVGIFPLICGWWIDICTLVRYDFLHNIRHGKDMKKSVLLHFTVPRSESINVVPFHFCYIVLLCAILMKMISIVC